MKKPPKNVWVVWSYFYASWHPTIRLTRNNARYAFNFEVEKWGKANVRAPRKYILEGLADDLR